MGAHINMPASHNVFRLALGWGEPTEYEVLRQTPGHKEEGNVDFTPEKQPMSYLSKPEQ